MKTVEQMAMELCGKTGLAGSAWARDNRWLAVFDAIASARADALEEAAKVVEDYKNSHRTRAAFSGDEVAYGKVLACEDIDASIRALKERG